MAKVYLVQKARKDQGKCDFCHREIEAGQAYRWFANFRGPKHKRHTVCPVWRPSAMEGNDKMAEALVAVEDADDSIAAWSPAYDALDVEDLVDALATCASGLTDAVDMFRESAESIREGFGHDTQNSEEQDGKADEIESFASELESVDFSEDPPKRGDWNLEAWEEEADQWIEDQRDIATNALSNFPF